MPSKAPDAFRTISEAADELELPQHVLRFWETKFSQIRPTKRSSGRRFYRPEDVDLLRTIRDMLYGQGYTIRGVQRLLKERGRTAGLPATNEVAVEVERSAPEGADDEPVLREAEGSASSHNTFSPELASSYSPPYAFAAGDHVASAQATGLSAETRGRLEALRAELEACALLLAQARRGRL